MNSKQPPSQFCSDCARWREAEDPRMAGYGHCDALMRWEYRSESAACTFAPARFKPLSKAA